jgi:hypothetical protein
MADFLEGVITNSDWAFVGGWLIWTYVAGVVAGCLALARLIHGHLLGGKGRERKECATRDAEIDTMLNRMRDSDG